MIRRLSQNDHEQCFALLKRQPAENLFLIGDIEAFGYDQEFQKVWGEFNGKGELIAVLLRYEENFIPYAISKFNAQAFAEIMDQEATYSMMSGLKEITEQIEPYIKMKRLKRKRQFYYAKCTELSSDTTHDIDMSTVLQAVPDDAEELVTLLRAIPEFNESHTTVESKRRGLEKGVSRSFFIRENGKMVSTASTTAENTLSAMVVGVATLEDYKKKGYASKCMVKLCKQLLAENKELCLFYDNPAAGAIYKRIGFKDIGLWMMNSYEDLEG